MPWNDPLQYVLVPGGALESRPRTWSFQGDTRFVRGNEPFHVHSDNDQYSLLLDLGASATTAPVCIQTDYSVLRFFARRTQGESSDGLAVDVVYTDFGGTRRSLRIGDVPNNGSWAPTATLPVFANIPLTREPGSDVAFRFTPEAGSAWQVDDVYVDPWRAK